MQLSLSQADLQRCSFTFFAAMAFSPPAGHRDGIPIQEIVQPEWTDTNAY